QLGRGVQFNPTLEAANKNKYEETYDNNEEMDDVERENEFYELIKVSRARSANCTDEESLVSQHRGPRLVASL
ncbi:hypothetical protein GW17_00001903, partial [Ensete ventricosum]